MTKQGLSFAEIPLQSSEPPLEKTWLIQPPLLIITVTLLVLGAANEDEDTFE